MNKILRYLLLAVMVVGFTIPAFGKAEAAKIAVLPLATQEQDDTARRVWIEECMDYFKFPAFDMVDDATLDKVLKEENYAVVGKQGPDEAFLKRVMDKTGADMAIMMTVDELSLEPTMLGGREPYYELVQKTRIMMVNNISGKVSTHRVNDSDVVEDALITRGDYMHDEFRNTVIREIKNVVK